MKQYRGVLAMATTKEQIKKWIKHYLFQYTNVSVDGDDSNLFCTDYNIMIPDVLYVVRALEDTLGVPVAKVFEKRDYTVFTVNNLADAIAEDFPEILL